MQTGNHNPDNMCMARSQRRGDLILFIVKAFSGFLNRFFCSSADSRMIVKCPGNSRECNIQFTGDIMYGGSFQFLNFLDYLFLYYPRIKFKFFFELTT